MLLMAIQQANLKPTMQLWSSVAASLGGGLSPSAVRCGHVSTAPSPLLYLDIVCFYLLFASLLPLLQARSLNSDFAQSEILQTEK
jgi:hypothetical protein